MKRDAYKQIKTGQQGAVLIVSLMVLLMLTVLTLSSAQTILLQEKMTASTRDARLAFQVAESAVKDAEAYLETNPAIQWSTGNSGTGGFYQGDVENGAVDVFNWPGSGGDNALDIFDYDPDKKTPLAFADSESRAATNGIDCGGANCNDLTGRYFIVNRGEKTFDLSASGNVSSETGPYKAPDSSILQACWYQIYSWGRGNNQDNSSDAFIVVDLAYECI